MRSGSQPADNVAVDEVSSPIAGVVSPGLPEPLTRTGPFGSAGAWNPKAVIGGAASFIAKCNPAQSRGGSFDAFDGGSGFDGVVGGYGGWGPFGGSDGGPIEVLP